MASYCLEQLGYPFTPCSYLASVIGRNLWAATQVSSWSSQGLGEGTRWNPYSTCVVYYVDYEGTEKDCTAVSYDELPHGTLRTNYIISARVGIAAAATAGCCLLLVFGMACGKSMRIRLGYSYLFMAPITGTSSSDRFSLCYCQAARRPFALVPVTRIGCTTV